MKRRSEISNRDSPKLRSSSIRGFNGFRNNRGFKADGARNKRVKFSESDVCPPSHIEPDASSQQHESFRPQRSDAPKTSEFAFFKKLKKDAGCSRSSVLHEECEKLIGPNCSTKDFTKKFKHNFEKARSSIHLEKTRDNSHRIFSSPQANGFENLDAAPAVKTNQNDTKSKFPATTVQISNQNLFLSPLGDAAEKSGSEDVDKDMFFQKRNRLLQWVAETSVPEIENLYSKGYDLVTVLMNRLFPDRDQSKHCSDAEATPMSIDNYSEVEFLHKDTDSESFRTRRARDYTEAEPLSYLGGSNLPNSPSFSQYLQSNFFLEDCHNEKSSWIKSRDLIVTDNVSYLNDNFNMTRDMIPFTLDTRIFKSPSFSHAHFQYGNNESYISNDDRGKKSFSLREPHFCSDIEIYKTCSLSHIERNEFLALDEPTCERENVSDTMLLGWDFANLQDKGDLSYITFDNEMNFLDFRSRSEITLYPYSHSEKHHNWESKNLREDCLSVEEVKQYPLPLPYRAKCIDVSEDHDTYTPCAVNDGISLQRHDWVISNILNERHYSDSEPLFPSGFDVDTYEMFSSSRELQSSSRELQSLLTGEYENLLYSSKDIKSESLLTEDTDNIHKWLSVDLHNSFRNEMVHPLLLKSSSSCLRVEESGFDEDI